MKIKDSTVFGATRSCKHGSQQIADHLSAHFCLVKAPSIAIWGKQEEIGGWGGVGIPYRNPHHTNMAHSYPKKGASAMSKEDGKANNG